MSKDKINANIRSKLNQITIDIWFTINRNEYFQSDLSLNQYLLSNLKMKAEECHNQVLLLNIKNYFYDEIAYYGMELLTKTPLLIAMKKEQRN